MEKISFKKLGLAGILSIFLLFMSGGDALYGAYGEDEQAVFTPDMSVWSMGGVYHGSMNKLFNKKAKLLVTGKEDEIDEVIPEDGEKAALIQFCKQDPQNEKCKSVSTAITYCNENPDSETCMKSHDVCLTLKNNVTTYCVAIEASHLYIKYKDALMSKWNEVDHKKNQTISEAFQGLEIKRTFIKNQIDLSKKALDSTLSAYGELRWSFVLHREYKQIIKDLLKYRDKLADVRKYVEQYPDRFYNASTPYCE